MYLKSIEINGFKSFANKILFEFHDGITAIVGPNGSGKSNVADAVRWVLGEQSAKQLRGANMTDVIFAGSEVRKPMTFAYVCITFDNSDHVLAPDFDEISVSRRVYRSGESEYMINKTVCRLRDVQELFMDTGIGKEGYSIIGQGQIDRILSTKPEDRRELFDEAAGIVKFKKRKAIAIKNLEEERNNLSRVEDILEEINSRVGPLSEQAEVAKEYLRLKEQLKIREVNQYLLEYDKSESQCESLEEKLNNAREEYEQAKKGREDAQDEYNQLDERIAGFNSELDEKREKKNADALRITELEGEIKVLNGQISSSMQNDNLISSRIESTGKDIEAKNSDLEALRALKEEIAKEKEKLNNELTENNANIGAVHEETKKLEDENTEFNSSIKKLVEEQGKVKSELQKYETILEQNDIKKSELSQQLITNKSEETAAKSRRDECSKVLETITRQLEENSAKQEEIKVSIEKSDAKIKALRAEHEKRQQEFISEKSKLESLKNLAERYEGYGSSIQKIMSHRASVRGIEGVVADLISVDKKYEIAIETALGAGIQNIVVDTEQTAKHLISFLKVNRAGRATFLPLTSVKEREARDDHSGEKGVIGVAASLVKADKKYSGVIGYLLGRIIVVDNIDNALALAKKNDYSLRIVTLEGEQLNPGGSLSGGAYRNTSNLLGRKREIDELESIIEGLEKEVAAAAKKVDDAISDRRDLFG
ncbi:MAG: chromosome segregation protein SMC, partial [Lachnospiraceae bacterium]|nr:chromosome segregation protein SMC [Lachnospiraceae bacterium]